MLVLAISDSIPFIELSSPNSIIPQYTISIFLWKLIPVQPMGVKQQLIRKCYDRALAGCRVALNTSNSAIYIAYSVTKGAIGSSNIYSLVA